MTSSTVKPRSSRRLFGSASATSDLSQHLTLPPDCELVANTFLVFKWQQQYCVLQANITLYCWGRRRSGAIEHVLEKYGLTRSSQLHHINCKDLDREQRCWLMHIFLVVHRLFDDLETGTRWARCVGSMSCNAASLMT
jgi:hypothetical protein